MPEENYDQEAIKPRQVETSSLAPMSSLRLAAPRRRQHVAAVALSGGGSGRSPRATTQRHHPTKWECLEALDRNRDGSYLDAADELLWKYAVEHQQLDALRLSPTERMVANIVRAYVPTDECGFYLQLHNDNIQDAATGVRNENNRAQARHEEQATPGATATAGTVLPFTRCHAVLG